MPNAWVLLTAMPPTKGHEDLLDFAYAIAGDGELRVLLGTQPDEPFVTERMLAVAYMTGSRGGLMVHYDEPIQQVPNGDDDSAFWEMWRDILVGCGLQQGDYIVASEEYGIKLAEVCNCIFMPYDIERSINSARATSVRRYPLSLFSDIAEPFQRVLKRRITFFGAESVGKTTLSRLVSQNLDGYWIPEWARPYLETVGAEVTVERMLRIHQGQAALQRSATHMSVDAPVICQDTDLFSTVGYWRIWGKDAPSDLVKDAVELASDLYIVCPSNIPFKADPLRYGGDVRESTDEFWIDLCEEFGLNYVVLTESQASRRFWQAREHVIRDFDARAAALMAYERVV